MSNPAFKNAGQKIGTEIWRINRLSLEAVPNELYGNFNVEDAYIILVTRRVGIWTVHFWLGKKTSPEQKETAASKAAELDDSLCGLPVQYREVQGHESALFSSLFKNGITYLQKDPVTLKSIEKCAESHARLYHCKGKRNVRCTEVECEVNSLNRGDVFILDCGKDIYLWMPPESGRLERIKGMAHAKSIRDKERGGNAVVHLVDEKWDKDEHFWNAMGVDKSKAEEVKSAEEGGEDEGYWRLTRDTISLWRVCDEDGKAEVTIVSDGGFKYSQLDSKDAFILDVGRGGIYVWIGKGCTKNEKKRAMEWAETYIQKMNLPDWIQVVRVLEGAEPDIFTQWASDWNESKGSTFEPRLYQCSDESGQLKVEEIFDFTQEDLDSDDVMILDGRNIIYVWVGANANASEKKHAQATANQFLEKDAIPRHRPSTEILFEGQESAHFKKFFPSWDDKLFKTDSRSLAKMRKLMFS